VEQVVQNTGFDLLVSDDVGQTPIPTDEQISLIRERVDPDGMLLEAKVL
jgi:glutaconate CoA-transferase subunit B